MELNTIAIQKRKLHHQLFFIFIAIIIVLKVFNGQSLPGLPFNISLNTFIWSIAMFGEVSLY
jgi:hypothetical protein